MPTIGSVTGFTATQTFTYDTLKRIKTAAESVGGSQTWKQTFNYDQFGNRTFDASNTTTIPSGCSTAVCNPNISTTTNRISSSGYTFDDSGNLTQTADDKKFVYDANNKIVELRTASTNALVSKNYYDGDGSRVKIEENGVTTIFIQDAFGKVIAEYTLNAASNPTPKVSYLCADMLGTPRVITDENRQILSRRDMTPFGEEIAAGTGSRNTNQGYSVFDNVRQKFTGQQRDETAKLDYFNARHYAYPTGRFMSADNFGGKVSNPQSLNLYAYALNNPLKWVDPTGHFSDDPSACIKDGVAQCTRGEDGKVKKPDGSDYQITDVVNVNSDNAPVGPSGNIEKAAPPPLPPSFWDWVPVYGSLRQFAYNANCHGGGCNVGRAIPAFIQLAADLSPIGGAARGWSLARNAFVTEVLSESVDFGAQAGVRAAANSGGRLGNAGTRAQIDSISTALESRGYTITNGGQRGLAEEFLKPLNGGRSGGSFVDITATRPGYPTLRINTVDTLKNGITPTARELRNAERIRQQIAPGQHLLLIPKQ